MVYLYIHRYLRSKDGWGVEKETRGADKQNKNILSRGSGTVHLGLVWGG